MAIFNKMTIVPLHYSNWQNQLSLPIGLGVDLTVESVDGLLKPELFDLWREYVPKKDTDDLASAQIGIVHRFSSEDHVGPREVASVEKINKAFVLLRLIRPTRERFSNIQVKFQEGQADVFSFAQPGTNVPNCPYLQVFNRFHQLHLEKLVRMLPRFLSYIGSPIPYRTRSIRLFETGYSQIFDPLLQFVTWMIGIESFFAKDEAPVPQKELMSKIQAMMGNLNIYSDAENELFPTEPAPITVGEILPDLFTLRHHAVHGVKIPSRFDDLTIISAATQQHVHYVDVLREAASFVLQNLVLDAVEKMNV